MDGSVLIQLIESIVGIGLLVQQNRILQEQNRIMARTEGVELASDGAPWVRRYWPLAAMGVLVVLTWIPFIWNRAESAKHESAAVQALPAVEKKQPEPIQGTPLVVPEIKPPASLPTTAITQNSSGANSQNVATNGPNSPIIVNPPVVPWELNNIQFAALQAALAPYARTPAAGNDILMASGMDGATMKLTQQFVNVFRAAGWQIPVNGFSTGFGGSPLIGIMAIVHSADSVPPEINAIAEALGRTGFLHGPLAVAIEDGFPKGQFQLRIGIRPD